MKRSIFNTVRVVAACALVLVGGRAEAAHPVACQMKNLHTFTQYHDAQLKAGKWSELYKAMSIIKHIAFEGQAIVFHGTDANGQPVCPVVVEFTYPDAKEHLAFAGCLRPELENVSVRCDKERKE